MFNPNVTRYPLTRYCEVLNNIDLFAVVLLVVGPSSLHMVGMDSTTELYPYSSFCCFEFETWFC